MAGMSLVVGCTEKTAGAGHSATDAIALPANGETAVVVRIDPTKTGSVIGEDFSGVSFEMRMVREGRDGSHFFDAADKELVAMFRSLGIHSLRVGGNSLDSATGNGATEADIDSLFGFAKAANLKVIYSVRMKDINTPEQIADDVRQVKYLWSKYADLTTSVTIGNEPNIYFADTAPGGVGTAPAAGPAPIKTAVLGGVGDSGAVGIGYAAYRKQWEKIAGAIVKESPDVRLCGPSSTPGKVAWAGAFARDEGKGPFAKNLALITQHSYPGGNAQKVTDSGAGRELILSNKMEENYEKFYNTFATSAIDNQKPYRLEESNSLFHGGATNISNTAASALWGLDFMWWWAQHGAAGINFHTGMNSAPAGRTPGGYDLFWDSPDGIQVHPMGYAAKTFDIPGHGVFLKTDITNASNLNLTTYAIRRLDARGDLFVTIINRENVNGNTGGHDAAVTLDVGNGTWHAQEMFLKQDKNDLAATGGMTLGGATINKDGSWKGEWTNAAAAGTGKFLIHVKAGEAAIVRLARN